MQPVQRPITIAFQGLKETISVYALLADLSAFITLAVLVLSKWIPIWPHATVIAFIVLILSLFAILFTLGKVIITSEQTISQLRGEYLKEHDKVAHRRAELGKLVLESAMATSSLNLNSFLDCLKNTVFPFLVSSPEFGIRRVALIEISQAPVTAKFSFSYPFVKGGDPRAKFDQMIAEQFVNENSSEEKKIHLTRCDEDVFYYCPLHTSTEKGKGIYYLSFLLHPLIHENLQNSIKDFLVNDVIHLLYLGFAIVAERQGFLQMKQNISLKHYSGLLYLEDRTVRIEDSSEYTPEDLVFLTGLLQDSENLDKISQTFYPESSDQEIINVSRGNYNFSLVPIRSHGHVHHIALLVTHAPDRALQSDPTIGESMAKLLDWYNQILTCDDLTKLMNKQHFTRLLDWLVISSKHEDMFGIFVISIIGSTCQMYDAPYCQRLEIVATTLENWAANDGDQATIVGRYEGEIFLYARKVSSAASARAHAAALKVLIDEPLKQTDNQLHSLIGVFVFRSDFYQNGTLDTKKLILSGILNLQQAEKELSGVYLSQA